MPKLTLDDVKTGMVVAEAIKGSKGQPLFAKGVELTDKHLRILKIWGINSVIVEGDENEELGSNNLPPELLEQIEDEMKPRFQHTNRDHPVVEFLFKEAAKLKAIELSKAH